MKNICILMRKSASFWMVVATLMCVTLRTGGSVSLWRRETLSSYQQESITGLLLTQM